MCGRTIEPGESYKRDRVVDCGDAWTWRECAHCESMVSLLWVSYFSDVCWRGEGYSADDMGEFEPSSIAEARLKVYWKRGWRRRDGSLRPVPERIVA